MYTYTIGQWLLFFYMYCFFGWIFETTYVSIKQRKYTNRGFMRGPFLPIYGCGAILSLFVTMPFRDNYVLMYFAVAISATILEYITGVAMEKIFKVRYWDYSYKKIQFKGHICLSSTIAWGFFGILLVKVIHKPMEWLFFIIHGLAGGYVEELLIYGVTIYFVADFVSAFREAIELRDLLIYAEKAKDSISSKAHHLSAEFSQKVESVKNNAKNTAYEYHESFEEHMEIYKNYISERNARIIRRITNAHPTMYSSKFKATLSELREAAKNFRYK